MHSKAICNDRTEYIRCNLFVFISINFNQIWKKNIGMSLATFRLKKIEGKINGLVSDCGNSFADALKLPHSCTKPSKYSMLLISSHSTIQDIN